MTRSESRKNISLTMARKNSVRSSPSAENNINMVTPTKVRKKKLFKRSPKKPPKQLQPKNAAYQDIIYTETIGEFIVVTVHKQNGLPGYIWPVLKAIREGHNNLTDSDKFDCRIKDNLYVRESRQANEKVDLKIPGRSLYQLGFVSSPDRRKLKIAESSYDYGDTLNYEKLFRDEIEKVLNNANKLVSDRDEVKRFEPWDPQKHSKTTAPNRKMDHVFTDQSVYSILDHYYVQQDCEPYKVYDFLKVCKCQDFFSRFNGEYSQYAKTELGFPKLKVENGYESESEEDDSEDESGEE
jgi:hypothetical protein